jgi:Ca2+-binding RTX toxin-like protein
VAGSGFADVIVSGPAADALQGGGGNDTLAGLQGNDTLDGQADDDLLSGNQGNDTLEGGLGDDTLNGGQGNDVLHGGAGNDVMIGGPGIDTFVFEAGDGADAVLDFRRFDKLDLSSFGFADFAADVLPLVSQGYDTGFQLDFGFGDTLDVYGKTLAKFVAADVIL